MPANNPPSKFTGVLIASGFGVTLLFSSGCDNKIAVNTPQSVVATPQSGGDYYNGKTAYFSLGPNSVATKGFIAVFDGARSIDPSDVQYAMRTGVEWSIRFCGDSLSATLIESAESIPIFEANVTHAVVDVASAVAMVKNLDYEMIIFENCTIEAPALKVILEDPDLVLLGMHNSSVVGIMVEVDQQSTAIDIEVSSQDPGASFWQAVASLKSLAYLGIHGVAADLEPLAQSKNNNAVSVRFFGAAANATSLQFVSSLNNVTSVSLNNGVFTASDFSAVSSLPGLVDLELSGGTVKREHLQLLKDCNLKSLVLRNIVIGDECVSIISRMRSLNYLDIKDAYISIKAADVLADKLPEECHLRH